MRQYTENQYDDDLTVGTDDYDDSYYTGSVDLFEFSNNEESPISRLKTLILSIDWEITDEILMQFNEELVDLRDIWAGEKINLVYVQALEKISKYIYQKKANSHPSAIKLLLTLYHNLEKIVSSFDLTEEQKKAILLEDVRRFESLKKHIGKQTEVVDASPAAPPKPKKQPEDIASGKDLLNLKAIVLGIDWEITDQDLNDLRKEVVRLEQKFADSRPKLILLQGIGTLGAYIKLKKSNAHADAFKILHLFYESLEKTVSSSMRPEEEKAILFPAVERFNAFKTLLGSTIAPEAIHRNETDEEIQADNQVAIVPAFADLPEKEIKGFQAEEEAESLGLESSNKFNTHVESFFTGNNALQSQEDSNHIDDSDTAVGDNRHVALQGVDVEFDDEEESETGVLSGSSELSPALSDALEEESDVESAVAFQTEDDAVLEESFESPAEEPSFGSMESFFGGENGNESGPEFGTLDKDVVLQGVDVETEADDDSDEDALPMMGGELAPALAENDEYSIYGAEILEESEEIKNIDDEIIGTLGKFFDDEIDSHTTVAANKENEAPDAASMIDDAEETSLEDGAEKNEIGEDASAAFTMEGAMVPEEPAAPADEITAAPTAGTALQDHDEDIAFVSELDQEENLDSFFDDNDFEQSVEAGLEEDVLDESFDSASSEESGHVEQLPEIDEQLESFFDLGEGVEEPEEDKLLFALPEEEEAGAVVSPVTDGIIDDQVVFELAAEEEGQPVELTTDIAIAEETSSDEVAPFNGDLLDSAPMYHEDERLVAKENEEFPENRLLAPVADKVTDIYGPLGTCIDSLGIEIDDKILLGLQGEIDHLRQNLTDKPLEKTFLQLISTITRHIDHNRYDSSADAYGLLQSVCRALMELREDEPKHNQAILLTETDKVLTWQEKLLVEQVARNEAELTIDDSNTAAENIYSKDSVPGYSEGSASVSETQGRSFAEEDAKMLTDDLKEEISTLRRTLQNEIAELRKELKGKYS